MPSYTGSCNCGSIAYTVDVVDKPVFNILCHCRACARARGVSPVHIYGVTKDQFEITKGESNLNVVKGMGSMLHAFCTECGCHIYQYPEGRDFLGLFPVNFHIETDSPTLPCGKSCMLPKELMPLKHMNYENRIMDAFDDLPKYTAFNDSPRLNNDGSKYEE